MKRKFGKVIAPVLVFLAVAGICLWPLVKPAFARTIGEVGMKLGQYTGPIAGTAQDDNVKASLDLAHTDLDTIIVDTAPIGVRCAEVALSTIATSNDLFAVTGGPIIIRDIVGVVTTNIVATTCLINYNIDPTEPATDTVFGTDGTAMEINGDAAGTVYTWDGVIATDLTPTTNGVVLTQGHDVSAGILCPIGMIELAATATNAGAIKFYMIYSPLSPNSLVTPQ